MSEQATLKGMIMDHGHMVCCLAALFVSRFCLNPHFKPAFLCPESNLHFYSPRSQKSNKSLWDLYYQLMFNLNLTQTNLA